MPLQTSSESLTQLPLLWNRNDAGKELHLPGKGTGRCGQVPWTRDVRGAGGGVTVASGKMRKLALGSPFLPHCPCSCSR